MIFYYLGIVLTLGIGSNIVELGTGISVVVDVDIIVSISERGVVIKIYAFSVVRLLGKFN